MTSRLFSTPEEAAMEGFPPAYCRVLAVDIDGDDAFVVLDAGPGTYRYLYSGTVERTEGGWRCGGDSNGGGLRWSRTVPMEDEEELGVVAISDEAPVDAEAARVEWRGEVRETPVRNGVYLMTWFREPWPDENWPRVTAFRVGGHWRPARREDFDWLPADYQDVPWFR